MTIKTDISYNILYVPFITSNLHHLCNIYVDYVIYKLQVTRSANSKKSMSGSLHLKILSVSKPASSRSSQGDSFHVCGYSLVDPFGLSGQRSGMGVLF